LSQLRSVGYFQGQNIFDDERVYSHSIYLSYKGETYDAFKIDQAHRS